MRKAVIYYMSWMTMTTVNYLFLINQKRRTNYPNLFCYKTLHVSGIFSAQHQEFSTVHSGTGKFHADFDDRFKADSELHPDFAWKRSSKPCMRHISAECTVEDS
jgi:hypothetical protein